MSELKNRAKSTGVTWKSAATDRVVVPSDGKWAVRGSTNKRASSVHDTKVEAIKFAREAMSDKGGMLVVHDGKGRIRLRYSIGRDPFRKISAVEGIAPTGEARARGKKFARDKLSSEERLHAIIEAYRPSKGR